MARCRIVGSALIACALAACGGGSKSDDRSAHRQAAPTLPGSSPNAAPLAFATGAVACDGGELFAVNAAGLTVHDRTATGDQPPLRVLAGDATGLTSVALPGSPGPRAVALDVAHDELFVSAPRSVRVFPRTASGDVAPARVIAGPSTGLYTPGKLAFDARNGELWVTEDSRLAAFSRDASGDAAPIRTIVRNIMDPFFFQAVAVDPEHDELVAASSTTIRVYPRTASGVSPTALREIGGPATGLASAVALAIDPARDEILAIDQVSYATTSAVLSFPRTASGNVAPVRKIAGPTTTMLRPNGLVVDTARDEVIVANASGYPGYLSMSGNSITAYPRAATGDVAPVRLLRGLDSGLAYPADLALLPATVPCASGYACGAGGCVPPGAVDCGNGHHCASLVACGYDLTNRLATCIVGGQIVPAPALCAFGTSCPAGSSCGSGGCLPTGAVDCGGGLHCPSGSTCTSGGTACVPSGATDCLNGRYCPAGTACNMGGLWCQPAGVVDCGSGWYCASGRVCTPAGDGFTCDPPPSGGGGGAYCYSTSACIYGAYGTCDCAGAASQTQCLSGHPACAGVGSACGDGVHACCGGETCINGKCEPGCGRCAGKGCTP